MKYPFIAAAALLCLGACRQSTTRTVARQAAAQKSASVPAAQPVDSTATAAVDSGAAKSDFRALNALLRSMRPEASVYLVSGTAPQTITGDKGIRLRVVPDDLETADGGLVSGPIEITLTEMTSAADFILNGAPTMSGGRLLESGGAVDIRCKAGGKALRIKKGLTMELAFPKSRKQGMELFYGGRDGSGTVDWRAAGQPVSGNGQLAAGAIRDGYSGSYDTVSFADSMAGQKLDSRDRNISAGTMKVMNGIAVDDSSGQAYLKGPVFRGRRLIPRGNAVASAGSFDAGYDVLRISQMGLVNCDRFVNTPMAELVVTTPAGTQGAALRTFYIFKNMNAVWEQDLRYSSGGDQQQSVRLPGNSPVRMVALQYTGKSIYAFATEVTPGQGLPVKVELKPVTRAEMERLIAGKG